MIAAVATLGAASLAFLVSWFEPTPLDPLAWLILAASTALVVCFPYRVDSVSRSYFLDFDEALLVIALLYLSPQNLVSAMLIGYIAGAIMRRTPAYRILFNTGLRATSPSPRSCPSPCPNPGSSWPMRCSSAPSIRSSTRWESPGR